MVRKALHSISHTQAVNLVRRILMSSFSNRVFLWKNQTGTAWQGHGVFGADRAELINPRPVKFGIPDSGGGTDLLGFVIINNFPVFLGIEIKTGRARRTKKQHEFANFMNSHNAVYFLFRVNSISGKLNIEIDKA